MTISTGAIFDWLMEHPIIAIIIVLVLVGIFFAVLKSLLAVVIAVGLIFGVLFIIDSNFLSDAWDEPIDINLESYEDTREEKNDILT